MAEHSTIEWTDATWNPITGCSLVSEGCRHCYAATLAATRLKNHPSRKGLARLNAAGEAKFTGEVRLNEQWLDQPLRWRRPRRIFVCAHGDLFHEAVPDEWIDRVFAVMALAPHHTFQVLTKRPERAREYLRAIDAEFHASPDDLNERFGEHCCQLSGDPCAVGWFEDHVDWPLPNVWLGTSAEDQATADARIPHLLATPAALRFVSAEPLLGPVDLDTIWLPRPDAHTVKIDALTGDHYRYCGLGPMVRCHFGPRLDWVIVGGESGPGARPMHPDWARSLRDQCRAAGVAFFFKQWGEWGPLFDPRTSQHDPNDSSTWGRAGHRAFGCIKGVTWIEENVNRMQAFGAPDAVALERVGKKATGRLLDGREWSEMPEPRT